MQQRQSIIAVAIVLTLVLIAVIYYSSGNRNIAAEGNSTDKYVVDAATTTRVKTALALNKHLSAFDINVETTDNKVTLTGQVRTDNDKRVAEDIVGHIDGVSAVVNNLKVDPKTQTVTLEQVEQVQAETANAKTNEAQAHDDANNARLQTEEANRERDIAQQRFHTTLSEILETRREARGLIVNLSGVLFDTSQVTLKPGAREKLSKLAGILLAYPGAYRIKIEGHTDAVGSDEENLNLSWGRAESVRDYLVLNGIQSKHIIAARGFGESNPISGNKMASGRRANRRVEIVINDHVNQVKTGNNKRK